MNNFDPETVKAMQEVFGGFFCNECSKPAERLTMHGRNKKDRVTRYYCHDCYKKSSNHMQPVEIKECRDNSPPRFRHKNNRPRI